MTGDTVSVRTGTSTLLNFNRANHLNILLRKILISAFAGMTNWVVSLTHTGANYREWR